MRLLVLCAMLEIMFQSSPQNQVNRIKHEEVIKAILQHSDCADPDLKPKNAEAVRIDGMEYFDFTGDRQDETVVVASTCMAGNGGPDVHAVYTRDARGMLREMPIARPKIDGEMATAKYGMLYGNRNYDLSVENGLLVETYYDSTGRDKPLVVRYKWNGKEFVVHSVEKTGPFKTSYDCTKAEKEIEQLICYVKPLADLDLKLADLYGRLMREAPDDGRKALREDQRNWLEKRNSDCLYKFAAQCLEEMYKARIVQLASH